jgi:hypothetical protein
MTKQQVRRKPLKEAVEVPDRRTPSGRKVLPY